MRTCQTACFVALALAGSLASQTEVEIAAVADASLYAANNNANGAGTSLFTGANSMGRSRRSLLRFDVSGIPAFATVTSVELDLTPGFSNANNEIHTLHRVLESWDEGPTVGGGSGSAGQAGDVTWLSRELPSTLWTTPGGDFVSLASASLALANSGTQTFVSTPDLVADVQLWVEDAATNDGWMLRGNELLAGSAYRINSRESGMLGPRIRVTYTVDALAESFGTSCMGMELTNLGGLPTVGNNAFGLAVSNPLTAFSAGTMLIASEAASGPIAFIGCPFWVEPASIFASAPLSSTGQLPLPIPADASLAGLTLAFQGAGIDQAAATLLTSNGFRVRVGS